MIVAPKACTVIVHDLNDTAHQLDVTAETLYEVVAQALAMVRGHHWVGDIGRGLTTVTVKVRNPEITHIVKILRRPMTAAEPAVRYGVTELGSVETALRR